MSSITDDLRPLDEQAFGARVEPHRRELHVHCYRLLGSFEEAEDLVQEAFLRAWRWRETYEGRASVRAWLYRIATNACLDALDKRPRRPSASGEVAWLQPYPDELLEQLPDRREGPEGVALAKETVELAFIAAIQHLAPLPRAVLVLRDVLGCSAKETARLLDRPKHGRAGLDRRRVRIGGVRQHAVRGHPRQRAARGRGLRAQAGRRRVRTAGDRRSAGAGRGRHRDRHLRRRGVRALRPAGHAQRGGGYEMNAPASITVTPVFVADLSVEGERMPVYVHVIDHPDARVLVDTGMTELHPAMADMDPRLQPLSEQDFDLAGIDIVVNTHLHADHCGGNHLFAGRPIYVQRRELDDARSDDDDYPVREWVDAPGVRYVPVDGELELLPGLRLVPAPGHTDGMQVVVVETGGGRASS